MKHIHWCKTINARTIVVSSTVTKIYRIQFKFAHYAMSQFQIAHNVAIAAHAHSAILPILWFKV